MMKRKSRKWCTAEDRMVNDKDVPKSYSAPLQKNQGDTLSSQVHPKSPGTLFATAENPGGAQHCKADKVAKK